MLFTSREKFYSALWEDYRSYIKTAKSKDRDSIARDCTVCIIYFSEFYPDDDCSGRISSLFEQITVLMNTVQYGTVAEAFDDFLTEVSSHTYLENYADMNLHNGCYFCPEGTDEIFIPRLVPEYEMSGKPAGPTPREQKIMDMAETEEERNIANLRGKNL